ncbi:MAG: GNAT family N-acetyltransferase [Kiritimatiellia bacterium]
MDTPIVIRNAGFDDAEAIFRLIKTYPDELLARPVSDIVQNIDRFLVAVRGDEVVGAAAWAVLPEIGKAKQPSVEVKSVAVKRTLKGRGIGTRLVQAVIERIRQFKPTQIIVLTFTPDFFGKLGFVKVPKEKLMHKLYMGCVNCSKYDNPFTCPEVAMAIQLENSAS